ncbi:MAG: hypothetical protein KGZ62_10800 [Sulfurimonas sp.]|nr:hypothetical protein [Sulfurimonas sp.]
MSSITHNNDNVNKVDKALELYLNMPEDLFDFMFQNYCDFKDGSLEDHKKAKLDEFDPNWINNIAAAIKWAIKNEAA